MAYSIFISHAHQYHDALYNSLASRLDQTAGRVFQRSCAWELGDTRCTVNLGSGGNTGSGAVISVVSAFEFTASGLSAFASGIFSRGKIVWASGGNAGSAIEVKVHTQESTSARLTLFLPMPRPISAADAFTVTAGCDKQLATCRDRFSNAVNFGGFPQMPGNDFALSYASKDDNNDGSSLI